MRVCKNCGKENQDHYKFCLGCGAEVAKAPPDAPTQTPEPPTARGPVAELGGASPSGSQRLVPGTPSVVVAVEGPAAAMRICPVCSAEVPDFAFCGQCGARLPPASKAPAARSSPGAQRSVRGKLILIRPDGSEGGFHPLTDGDNQIGRTSGALFEADNYLSPHHAELTLGPSGLLVRDAQSLNGVFLKLTDEEELQDHDVFRIGQELLRFDVIHPPAALPDGTEVMGSPNPGYWGRVALIIGKDQDGSAFPLFGDAIVLGRERGDILFPEDGYVSGTHARLSTRNGRFHLADMNSSNGTFLRIRGERQVRSGAYLLMGQQLFRVQYS